MRDGHGGVVIGSEISGGCRNVFTEECEMDSPHLDRVLRLKSNAARGGTIENIFMRRTRVGQVADSVLQIDFQYEEGPNGSFKPAARNVVLQDVTVKETPRILNIAGIAGATIEHVRVCDSQFAVVKGADRLEEAGDAQLVQCKVGQGTP
jgi:unsaturated rhamnogalacturonyl hydrolase